MKKEYDKRGAIGEKKFEEWLKANDIHYLHFDQSKEWKLNLLKGVKRPDYMVLIPHIGFILVDVKTKPFQMESGKYCMNIEEANKFKNLQRYFNLEVWYAIGEDPEYNAWYWISNDRLEEMNLEQGVGPYGDYYKLPRKEMVKINNNDSEGSLLEKLLKKELNRKL